MTVALPSSSPAKNPWLAIAGKYQDDPNWDEYQTAIATARQAANESEGIWLEGVRVKDICSAPTPPSNEFGCS
jgi:hypothetical protein